MQLHGDNKTGRIAFLGLMLTTALILSYIESLIPLNFAVPGMKLGLANLVVVILIYTYGYADAITVNLLRIVLAGFLFGNLSMIIYSCAGAVFSFAFMALFKRIGHFSPCGVSIVGGVTHNFGQIIIACLVVESINVLVYVPFLIIAGAVTGLLIGIIANILIPIFKRIGM